MNHDMEYTERARVRRKRRAWRAVFGLVKLLLITIALYAVGSNIAAKINDKTGGVSAVSAQDRQNGTGSATASGDTAGWHKTRMSPDDLSSGDLVIVNSDSAYPFKSELNLVSIYDKMSDSYFVKDKDVSLQPHVMDPLNRFMDDFCGETGLKTVNVVAGWRSYDDQQGLYNDSLTANGADYTGKYIAKPGCSEHHTGLAVDLSIYYADSGLSGNFDGTGEYDWILQNAWRYGFVQRYQSGKERITTIFDEPWHFRYVGLPHAYTMTEEGLCLEEYLEYLKAYSYKEAHLFVECLGQSFEIYYCAGYDITVPDDGNYIVSGNNMDGFIITISRSAGRGSDSSNESAAPQSCRSAP